MTEKEFKQKILFACLQNPALADGTDKPTRYESGRWPDAARKAVYVALDTADFIIENCAETFGITPDKE